MRYARNRTTSTRTMSALIMAIDSARAAIAARGRDVVEEALAQRPPTPEAPRARPAAVAQAKRS